MAKKIKTIKVEAKNIENDAPFDNAETIMPIVEEPTVEVHPSFEVVLSKDTGIKAQTLALINKEFAQFIVNAIELKEQAEAIVVTDVSQTDLMEQAKEMRKSLRSIRTNAENVRKFLKQDSIRYGNAVQGVYNIIHDIVKPLEEHLEKQEKFEEIIIAKEREELKRMRYEQVKGLEDFFPMSIDLLLIHEDDFNKLLNSAKWQKEAFENQSKKEEEERLLKKQQEDEERERLRQENIRLQQERQNIIEQERKKAMEEATKKVNEQNRRIEHLANLGFTYNAYNKSFIRLYGEEKILFKDIYDTVFNTSVEEFENVAVPDMQKSYEFFCNEIDEKISLKKQWDEIKQAREKRFFDLGFLRGQEEQTLIIVFSNNKNLVIRPFNKGKGYMERNDEDFEKSFIELTKMVEQGKAQAEQERADKLREEEEEKERASSDKDRLQAFIDKLSVLDAEIPQFKSKKGKQISKLASSMLGDLSNTLSGYLNELK